MAGLRLNGSSKNMDNGQGGPVLDVGDRTRMLKACGVMLAAGLAAAGIAAAASIHVNDTVAGTANQQDPVYIETEEEKAQAVFDDFAQDEDDEVSVQAKLETAGILKGYMPDGGYRITGNAYLEGDGDVLTQGYSIIDIVVDGTMYTKEQTDDIAIRVASDVAAAMTGKKSEGIFNARFFLKNENGMTQAKYSAFTGSGVTTVDRQDAGNVAAVNIFYSEWLTADAEDEEEGAENTEAYENEIEQITEMANGARDESNRKAAEDITEILDTRE